MLNHERYGKMGYVWKVKPVVCQILCLMMLFGCVKSASFWGSRKVDCAVSIWSDFVDNPDGSRTRSRVILRYPENGGATCPPLNETDTINPWTSNSPSENAPRLTQSFVTGQATQQGIVKRQTTILPRDILFIIDSSGSVGQSNFDIANDNIGRLIAKICGTIGLGTQDNRVAAISYSNAAAGFDFDDYANLADVQNAINSLIYYGGGTYTAEALDHAKTDIFVSSAGMRPASVKEVVILSDGMANGPGNPTVAASFLSASQNPNIAIYAFFIGTFSVAGSAELQSMVSSPVMNHLFIFPNTQSFQDTVDIIESYEAPCAPIVFGTG